MADEVKLSAIPERMINDGKGKSRILVTIRKKDKPRSKTWVHVGSTMGEFYALEGSEIKEDKKGDASLVQVKTDEGGQASLGLRLPNALGVVHLAAAKNQRDVKHVLEELANGKAIKPPRELGLTRITLDAGKPSKLLLEADSNEVVADGVSTATISALVTDEFGNPIQGEEVSFETDLGVIEDGMNRITDETGHAYATLTSREVGRANITASNKYKSWMEDLLPGSEGTGKGFLGSLFGDKGSKEKQRPVGDEKVLSAGMALEILPSKATNLIITVDESTVPADGETEATVCAEIKDEFGNPVEGHEIVFKTDLGDLSPEGSIKTDPEGRAVVRLRSKKVGVASVRAQTTGEGGLLSATEVTFEASSPASIDLQSESGSVSANGEAEGIVTATVKDAMGNAVQGRAVVFETNLGSIQPDGPRTTDKEGRANIGVSSRIAGVATITAKCEEASSQVEIEFVAGKPCSFAISLNPTVEEGWRSRLPSGHWENVQQALKALAERRFGEAIGILEGERQRIQDTKNFALLCDLAYAYQQAGHNSEAEGLYRSIIEQNSIRKEIRVVADGVSETFEVSLPQTDGGEMESKDFIDLAPRDYLVNIVVTDDHGNHIPDIQVSFEANFGWIAEDHMEGRTNSVGAATSLVTTFAQPGSSELEFAWGNLGLMKEASLDYSGAEECYRSAIKAVPESTRGLESLASVLVKTGDAESAKRCYYNLGRAYSRRGQPSNAVEYYGKAIELDPKYAKALAGYGTAYLRLGELERARRYLEESVKLDRSLKAALANLGLLYHLIGKFDKAIQMNKRALKLDPEFRPALVTLHQIHMACGERDKAAEYAKMIRKLGG